jgi:hypothetical protein
VRNCSFDIYSTGLYDDKHIDQCNCLENYKWSNNQTRCTIDCSGIDNAQGNQNGEQCNCKKDYIWDANLLQCVPTTSINNCSTNYVWNTDLSECLIDCTKVDHTIGNLNDGEGCNCQKDYIWDADSVQCLPSTNNC